MKKFFGEFKKFIAKGNVVDLAVAVIIGGAFNKIVTSLVNDVIMPLISLMVGGSNVTDWKWVFKQAEYDAAGNVIIAENALNYGVFLQTIIDFLIVAFTVFLIVKIFNFSRKTFGEISNTVKEETVKMTKKRLKREAKALKNNPNQVAETEAVQTETIISDLDTTNAIAETAPAAELDNTTGAKLDKTPATETAMTKSESSELLEVLKEIKDYLKYYNKD